MTDYQVAVIGLGGIGSAAAYWASRRLGGHVLGIEQYEVGHLRGGSEDHSRIIRLSYHTPAYVDLAKGAYETWQELEVDSGEQLILETGGLDLAPANASIGLDSYRSSMTSAAVVFEELDAGEIMRRWPQWRLTDDVRGLFQEHSGIVKASSANTTHRRLALEWGATLLEGAGVTAIRETGGAVNIEVDGRTYQAGSLIISAGAWTNRLLEMLGVWFPLEVTLEQVVYLTAIDPLAFHHSRFPIWIWMDEPSFYGFPIFGEPAVKIAWDRCEIVTDPDDRSFEPRADVIAAVRGFASEHLPAAAGDIRLAKTCLYTLPPDRDFIVDRVPGTDRVYVAVGAGHAFKFASLLGRILTDLAIDGVTPYDISALSAHRDVLQEKDPVTSYMV
ncbi:MAG TPA: N-methyl-L-tryptophan oxidase [Acidimicrobiia bacterium]